MSVVVGPAILKATMLGMEYVSDYISQKFGEQISKAALESAARVLDLTSNAVYERNQALRQHSNHSLPDVRANHSNDKNGPDDQSSTPRFGR